MALTADETAAVVALLHEQPGLTNSQAVKALGLPPTAQFSVANARRAAGIAEPPGTARPGRKPGRRKATAKRTAKAAPGNGGVPEELLEAEDAPSGPTRNPAATRLKSPLAVFKTSAVQGLSLWLFTTTGARNPAGGMNGEEALAVASPSVRIADRALAKYVKFSGPVNENLADLGAILAALASWLLRVWLLSLQAKAGQLAVARPVVRGPLAGASAGAAPVASWPLQHDAGADDSDLFSGSEPVAQSASSAADMPASSPAAPAPGRRSGPANAIAASDEFWNAVSPPERGMGAL